ncbi:Fe-S-containing hydro-lyase [Gottschalkiaceae bacterium SANA]|nr:Fe-S-containing hydro-lyase [Gottschalkiaceae bacterium SANA]
MKRIQLPLTKDVIQTLEVGEKVYLNGPMFTGRDAAHRRLVETLERGEDLPIALDGITIFYVGPSPARPGQIIGSAGPTTSYRMDDYTPRLLEEGLLGMIGKGRRSPLVRQAIQAHGAVYFAALGGAGALAAQAIISAEVIAYPDLGPEAIHALEVKDFPVVVAVDATGASVYEREEVPCV